MPFHLFKGSKVLYYSGNILYNVNMPPNDFDSEKDLYISCDCEFPKWKNVERIIKK
jgi:hypothetical protein